MDGVSSQPGQNKNKRSTAAGAKKKQHNKEKKQQAFKILHDFNDWLSHRSHVTPHRTLPAPGCSGKYMQQRVVEARAIISGKVTGILWSPAYASRSTVSVKTNAGAAFTANPILIATAPDANTPVTFTPLNGSGSLDPQTVGHTQYVGCEVVIDNFQVNRLKGGRGYPLDGSTGSCVVSTDYASATPSLVGYPMNKMITAPRAGGMFDPSEEGNLRLRFAPHGLHVEEAFESNYFLTESDLTVNRFLVDSTGQGQVNVDSGYSQGFLIESADATSEYVVTLRYYYRIAPQESILNGAPSLHATTLVSANPQRMASLSNQAQALAAAARNTGAAVVSKARPALGNAAVRLLEGAAKSAGDSLGRLLSGALTNPERLLESTASEAGSIIGLSSGWV